MKTQRNTVQMCIVLEAVAKLANHPTADEVYAKVIQRHKSISRGTVYRNLDKLAREGVIDKIEVSGKAYRFDHRVIPHYHAICDSCFRLFDIESKSSLDLDEVVKESKHFVINEYVLTFHGICKQCQTPGVEFR